jgi:hypothetical protein
LNEPFHSVLPVSFLGSETPCIDQQNACLAHSLACDSDEPSPGILGQGRGTKNIESQLDRSGDFVDILASWA